MTMGLGETISHQLWTGPGAQSFYSAATALANVAAQVSSILDGQQATAGVLSTAWASPTGDLAISANSPYGAWLAEAAAHIGTAATQVEAAGMAFDAAKAATPTPTQFWWNNCEYAVLMATNILGLNWPSIVANRVEHTVYTIMAATAMAQYTGESAGTVGAIQPLSVPPVSATPALAEPSISAALAGEQPIGQAMQAVGAVAQPVSAALQQVSATTPLLSQLLSQPSNALMTSGLSGGELAQAPTAMTSGLAGLGSQTADGAAGLGGAGADTGSLIGAAPASEGTVAAALSGGGAGLRGFGGAALAPMRGPVSWSSMTNAANPTTGPDADGVVASRVAAARAASAPGSLPATSAGMGAPGTMMPPAQQGSTSQRQRERNGTLAAAVLYRPPRNMPVVTGAAGAQFGAGEGD